MGTYVTESGTRWPTCEHCGSVLYVGMRQTATYCSDACRSAAYRARKVSPFVRRAQAGILPPKVLA